MPASWEFGRRCLPALAVAGMVIAGPALADEFPLQPGQIAVGQTRDYVVRRGDTLMTIARHSDIGYTELLAANPGFNDPWDPGVGRHLTIPGAFILPNAPHTGIVINLAERRLYYFPRGSDTVQTYPVGIGVEGRTTPLSTTRVVAKVVDPTWYPPPSIRAERPELPAAIPPGPDDPLGKYALRLGWKNYLIHDTNKPDGVGRNVSHGCIHLYPEDIERLFNETEVGTQVRVVDQPVAAAWIGNRLYVEAHPSKEQADQIDMDQSVTRSEPAGLRETVAAAAGANSGAVDWRKADAAGMQRSGLPVEIAGRGGPAIAAAPAAGTVIPAPAREVSAVSAYTDELARRSLREAEGSGDDEGPAVMPENYEGD